jgi:hypothetical protein
VSWRSSLTFCRDSLGVLVRQSKKDQLYTSSFCPSLSSEGGADVDFTKLRWSSVRKLGFVFEKKRIIGRFGRFRFKALCFAKCAKRHNCCSRGELAGFG